MKPEDLLLADVLDFRPDRGTIRFQDQRVVILSATAMGLLRKELLDSLGGDTARRLLLRFGFADGYHDAVNLRDRSGWADPIEGLRAGATLHTLEGIVRAVPLRLEFDDAAERVERAVAKVLRAGLRTADIQERGGRAASTAEMGDAVVAAL